MARNENTPSYPLFGKEDDYAGEDPDQALLEAAKSAIARSRDLLKRTAHGDWVSLVAQWRNRS